MLPCGPCGFRKLPKHGRDSHRPSGTDHGQRQASTRFLVPHEQQEVQLISEVDPHASDVSDQVIRSDAGLVCRSVRRHPFDVKEAVRAAVLVPPELESEIGDWAPLRSIAARVSRNPLGHDRDEERSDGNEQGCKRTTHGTEVSFCAGGVKSTVTSMPGCTVTLRHVGSTIRSGQTMYTPGSR